jgi:hypothetical protein
MSRQNCLEDLESRSYHEGVLVNEISNRLSGTFIASGLGNLDGRFFQKSLMSCGFSFLEALYLVCGPGIQNCSLLSRETQKLARRIVETELGEWEGREAGDPLDNKLNKFVKEIDETLFQKALRDDSIRLDNIFRTGRIEYSWGE